MSKTRGYSSWPLVLSKGNYAFRNLLGAKGVAYT